MKTASNLNTTAPNLNVLQARLTASALRLQERVIQSDSDLLIAAAYRVGKTHGACLKVRCYVSQGLKGYYVVRNHRLAENVVIKLDKLGLRCLHLAGKKHRKLDYNVVNSITPKQFYRKYKGSKLEKARELLENGEIDVIVTVPELAVKLPPNDFLVLDEVTTIFWFKQFSQPVWEIRDDRCCKTVINKVALAERLATDKRVRKYLKKVNEKLILLEDLLKTRKPTEAAKIIEEELNSIPTPVEELRQECEAAWDRPVTLEELYPQLAKLNKMEIEKVKTRVNEPVKEEEEEVLHLALSMYNLVRWVAIPQTRTVKLWAKIKPILLFDDWLRSFQKLIVCVPSSRLNHAKEFLAQLGKDATVIEESSVPYAGNYLLYVTDNVYALGAELYKRGVPVLWVTGRKVDAERLKEKLMEWQVYPIVVEKQSVEEVRRYAKEGKHIIVYLNSRISQGIDLPEFNVVIVDSYKFGCIDLIPVEEFSCALWETVFRTAPTPQQKAIEKLQPKVIIFKRVKKRSRVEKEFCEWFVEPHKDWEKIVNSTWLPCKELPQIPSYISWRSLVQLNYPLGLSVERTEEEGLDVDLSTFLSDRSTSLIDQIKITYSTKLDGEALRKYWFAQALFTEKLRGVILNRQKIDLVRLVHLLSGRRLCAREVYEKFRLCGIGQKKLIADILTELERDGLLYKQRKGRQVIYIFADLLAAVLAYFCEEEEVDRHVYMHRECYSFLIRTYEKWGCPGKLPETVCR